MNSWLTLLVLALATARLTRLVTTDHICERLREWIWKKFGDPGSSMLGYLITCNWCTSIYAASLAIFMYKIAPDPTFTVCAILALSMFAGSIVDRAG